MTPNKAQRTWHSLSSKWINAVPYGSPFGHQPSPRKRSHKRKVKKGILVNFIPVEVVNAITGEVAKGYMRDFSIKRLRKWLEFHNHKAQVEQVYLSLKSTLHHLSAEEVKDFPILVKLGTYQVPYLIAQSHLSLIVRGRQTITLDLKTVDNLKYLETIADRKAKVMKLFHKIKKGKKK
jgi:hypothetical protein